MKIFMTNGENKFLKYVVILITILTLSVLISEFYNRQKEYVVAGAIRNVEREWIAIDDRTHKPINIDKITVTEGGSIVIYFKFKANTINTFLVTTDERFASLGYFVGAAVGSNLAKITIYQNKDGIIQKVPAHTINNDLGNFWIYGIFS